MSTRRARQLRNTMTPAEVILWSGLKRLRNDGFHFRRQAPFRDYYLDFVCFDRRLVVEVDGAHHQDDDRQADHDLVRDSILRRQGFEVIRIPNGVVKRDLDGVVQTVLEALRTRPALRGSRLHQAGASPSSVEGRIA